MAWTDPRRRVRPDVFLRSKFQMIQPFPTRSRPALCRASTQTGNSVAATRGCPRIKVPPRLIPGRGPGTLPGGRLRAEGALVEPGHERMTVQVTEFPRSTGRYCEKRGSQPSGDPNHAGKLLISRSIRRDFPRRSNREINPANREIKSTIRELNRPNIEWCGCVIPADRFSWE